MNTREKFSGVLLGLGLILAFLPDAGKRSLKVKPDRLLSAVLNKGSIISVDQMAKYIVAGDSTIHIIDLRSPEEFRNASLPGSVNIPYNELLDRDPASYLVSGNTRNIFYSNGDLYANYAVVIAKGFKYENAYAMAGGMNEWFKTVMNSTFTGDRISARENAVFETRNRAKKMFSEINSLPDSLKLKIAGIGRNSAKKLDGGCE